MTAVPGSVRRAVRADLRAVQVVGLMTWPPTYLPFTSPDHVLRGLAMWWSAEAVLETIVRDETFVAEVDGVVVGTATLGRLDGDRVIWKLYVVPGEQGRGVGHALMQAMLDEVAGEPVFVEFVDGNERARRFYERHGFVPDRVERQDGEPGSVWYFRPSSPGLASVATSRPREVEK